MEIGNLNDYFKFFVALVAVVNPVGAIPVFINLTANQGIKARNATASIAALSVGIILMVVLFTGEAILRFFGISVGSFRVGGGILILLMAIAMLNAKISNIRQTKAEELDSTERDSVAVVPLATPLLAGPGAISAVILHAQRHDSTLHYLYLSLAVVALTAITGLLLFLAPLISQWLGKTGINIVTRLMGLVMAAMGVEFIAHGLKQLFPILGAS
jgi:multiple antibiotic resistance protein